MPIIDPFLPCNFSNSKLSFYIPSDFSPSVLQTYGPQTRTILFGVIPPNARFPVTPAVLATLVEYASYLPDLECIFSCSGNVSEEITDEDIVPLVRAFRGLKSIYLDGYKSLTDRTFIAILYSCPVMEEIIISAGEGYQGLLTQKSLGAFFNQPRVGTQVTRVELLHQSPTAFTDDIILPLVYDFATLGREFRFWKTAPLAWESWMLPEPGEVGRDEVQRKIAFGPEWFKKKSMKERLKVIESWGAGGISSGNADETSLKGVKGTGKRGQGNQWKGSIRKRMMGGLL
jgi:hypothetical protein